MSLAHQIASDCFIDSTSVVDEPVVVGPKTKVWHFCHLCAGAQIGAESILGQGVYVGAGVVIGNRVKIQNHVSVYAGVEIEDDVFVGPGVTFTNVKSPRSFVDRSDAFVKTRVSRGATLGANATIVCGVTVGEFALVGAGAVVIRDVPPYAQVVGNPARVVGWVNRRGEAVAESTGRGEVAHSARDALNASDALNARNAINVSDDIKMLDPAAENSPFQVELEAAAQTLLASGAYILGEPVARFEAECARYLGARHAVAVSSGTDALLLSLAAAGVGQGDEVVTTAFSFIAGVEAILRLGATPKFVDIHPHTHLMDVDQVSAALSSKTKAILPVHLFGQALDLTELRPTLAARKIAVIEDAAQAFGAHGPEGPVGQSAFACCFSFFPSKNLGGFGDGGLVTTPHAEVAERLRRLRVHGAAQKYLHAELGGNYRLDALQAALLSVKLRYVPDLLARRRRHATLYTKQLRSLGLPSSRLTLPADSGGNHSFNQFVIETDRRDELMALLRSQGIESAIYYPVPLHLQPLLGSDQGAPGDFPRAELACSRVLALPVHPSMNLEQVKRICHEVGRCVARGPA